MASRTYLRVVFVLLGAAFSLALGLLVATVVALLAQDGSLPTWTVVAVGFVLAVAPIVVLGLVPAVRTVEGVAVHSLLGVELPGGPPGPAEDWRQRRRTLSWFALHLVSGAVLVAAAMATLGYGESWWLLPMLAGIVVVAALLGDLLARAAPRMLGPSYAERIELLERSVHRATERNRIAREIHDSVGHALSLVTVQAAAARKVIDQDPAFAVSALSAIETAARDAAAGLDHVLGLLREEAAPRTPEMGPDLGSLRHLVAATRDAGLALDYEVQGRLEALPPVVSREAYRIVQEGLTNALRHSADGTARLEITYAADLLRIVLRNPDGADRATRRGRGLRGIGERVDALGGDLTTGADGGGWTLDARLPLGTAAAR